AFRLGDRNRALLALDRAFALEPHTETLRLRGRILREAGRYQAAEVAYEGAAQAAEHAEQPAAAERAIAATRRYAFHAPRRAGGQWTAHADCRGRGAGAGAGVRAGAAPRARAGRHGRRRDRCARRRRRTAVTAGERRPRAVRSAASGRPPGKSPPRAPVGRSILRPYTQEVRRPRPRRRERPPPIAPSRA